MTAHPDDETLFFAGLIFSRPRSSMKVICVTNGDADGQGNARLADFNKACSLLEVESRVLDFPDVYENRLDVTRLANELSKYEAKEVFTHGIFGEYGHPHHQDVSFAVHKNFAGKSKVYSPAYNVFPEIRVSLSEHDWKRKFEILRDCYWTETKRFQQYLPCTWEEGFVRLNVDEVTIAYTAICSGETFKPADDSTLSSYSPYLSELNHAGYKRPF